MITLATLYNYLVTDLQALLINHQNGVSFLLCSSVFKFDVRPAYLVHFRLQAEVYGATTISLNEEANMPPYTLSPLPRTPSPPTPLSSTLAWCLPATGI